MVNLKTKRATKRELPQILDLYSQLNTSIASSLNYPRRIKGFYPYEQEIMELMKQRSLYVAKLGKNVVYATVMDHSAPTGYRQGKWSFESDYSDVLVIRQLAACPGHNHPHALRQLLAYCIELAEAGEARALRSHVYEGNVQIQVVFEEQGFKYVNSADLGFSQYGMRNFRLYEYLL